MSEEQQNNRESPNLAKSMKRSNKPLMEKRRRERINSSLEQLKSLVLEALNRDTSQYSKLEKADILEMTVKHLRNVQRQQLALAAAADNTVMSKYRAGFSECAQEVTRYLGQVDGLNVDTRSRLMHHLGNCVQRIHYPEAQQQQAQHPGVHVPTPTHAQPLHIQTPSATQVSNLPGSVGLSPQQAFISPGMPSVNGVPVIPAFNLSQLQMIGGVVIPTNSAAVMQQQQQQQPQHPQQQNATSCQYRDLNNNDVAMPSLMGNPHARSHEIPRAESRDSHYSVSSSSNQISPSSSSASSLPSPRQHHHHQKQQCSSPVVKQHPVVPEPIKLEKNPAVKVIVPQPQLGSVWRPWSSGLMVH